jgi:hypothetical protein
MSELPIVCTLDERALADRRQDLLARLAAAATTRTVLADGVALTFPEAGVAMPLLWQVLEAERQCCRFLRFRLTLEPALGPITLEITGPTGTREFLQSTLGF